jgi:hypothetical protein
MSMTMPIDDFDLHRHILHYAASALQICLPIVMDLLPSVANDTTTLDASKTQAKKWSNKEATDLIDFIYEHRSEASSPGNFKPSFWTTAKGHLDSKHPGSPRTVAAIKSKFTTVCNITILHRFSQFCFYNSIKTCTELLKITTGDQEWVQCLPNRASGYDQTLSESILTTSKRV